MRFLVFVLLEVPLLVVVLLVHLIIMAQAYALLVCFVVRVVPVVVLEKWSPYSEGRASANSNTHSDRQNPRKMF
jgi:NhaP-type Na+/H+ or K+/H+ antiporter